MAKPNKTYVVFWALTIPLEKCFNWSICSKLRWALIFYAIERFHQTINTKLKVNCHHVVLLYVINFGSWQRGEEFLYMLLYLFMPQNANMVLVVKKVKA